MTPKKKDVLQPVDDAARRLAKTLVRTARHGALATIDATDGTPSASRVSLATAMNGDPIFLISQLAGHFTNLEADPKCSLLVGEPGKGDPLAHPRVTLIGIAKKLLPGDERDSLKSRYLMRHPKSALYVDFADFAFWRFKLVRASLNGGFGKAYALGRDDLVTTLADMGELEAGEADAIAHMNSRHADAVDRCAASIGKPSTGWRLTGLDPDGLDLAHGDDVGRLWFEPPLLTALELRARLDALAKR